MTPETQALIATLEMFIATEQARRAFDTPEQAQADGAYDWSPEMQMALAQLEKLKDGRLSVIETIPTIP